MLINIPELLGRAHTSSNIAGDRRLYQWYPEQSVSTTKYHHNIKEQVLAVYFNAFQLANLFTDMETSIAVEREADPSTATQATIFSQHFGRFAEADAWA